MAENLPFGRGTRFGPNAFVDQQEAYALRAKQVDNRFRGIISPGNNIFGTWDTNASASWSAGTCYFLPIAVIADRIRLKEARAKCTVSAASSTLTAAVYVQDNAQRNSLRKISGSQAVFQTSGTGHLTFTLPNSAIDLGSNALIFLGCVFTGGTPTVVSAVTSTEPIFRIMTLSSTTLPTEVLISSLTKASNTAFPWVAYLSPELAEVL